MAGDSDFNQVFFENVRVPATGLLGEENRGWYLGVQLLDDERASSGDTGGLRRQLDDLRPHLPGDGPGTVIRHRYADLRVQLETARWLGLRAAWESDHGRDYSNASSATKLMSSELGQRIASFAVEVLGPAGMLRERSGRSVSDGLAAKRYLWAVMDTIGGGTSEIQRTIVAVRGLGLPRS
jgi:alkylation response protein AidB-like acyl-CoA dehydrogenase